jgi:hypothetical protein
VTGIIPSMLMITHQILLQIPRNSRGREPSPAMKPNGPPATRKLAASTLRQMA